MRLQIHHPLAGLRPCHAFRRWRDEMVHRAAHLPQVKGLRERERASHGTKLRRLLEWGIELEIPLVARAFVPRDALVLELAELWDEEGLGCDWALRSRGLPDRAAFAAGTMRFTDDGLHVSGEVRVDLCALPQVPAALAKSAGPPLEQGVARNIERGYVQLAQVIL